MHIRDVQADDAPAICRINRDALGYEFPVEDTRAQLERIIKAANVVLFVAVDDTGVLGYIQLSDYENTYHRPLKNLITLATSPRHHRRGVGRRLLEAGESWARADGASLCVRYSAACCWAWRDLPDRSRGPRGRCLLLRPGGKGELANG